MALIVRVHHPLQQGLRQLYESLVHITDNVVRVHHPLQQGLRLNFELPTNKCSTCASASSITTRIKTVDCLYIFFFIHGASASSITTRIKTVGRGRYQGDAKAVRVHHPLQQGLRLSAVRV